MKITLLSTAENEDDKPHRPHVSSIRFSALAGVLAHGAQKGSCAAIWALFVSFYSHMYVPCVKVACSLFFFSNGLVVRPERGKGVFCCSILFQMAVNAFAVLRMGWKRGCSLHSKGRDVGTCRGVVKNALLWSTGAGSVERKCATLTPHQRFSRVGMSFMNIVLASV